MKLFEYLRDNAWTWAGVVFILITLSGATRTAALFTAAATIVIHWVFTYLSQED